MTIDEAIKELEELGRSGVSEATHIRADDILLEIIDELTDRGGEIKEAYDAVDKWYA